MATDLRTIHSIFYCRRPTEEDYERLWNTFWYTAVPVTTPFETERAALEHAEELWEACDYTQPFIVRFNREKDFWERETSGWYVYRLELVPASRIREIPDGELEVWARALDESPIRRRDEAVWTLKKKWRQRDGQVGMLLRAEVIERAELVRRRLEKSERLSPAS